MKLAIHILLCATAAFNSLLAQVPSVISYQGRVQAGGTNFSGTGQFKFALVSSGTNITRQATATATVTSGFVTSISVTEGGVGYPNPPAVTIIDSTGIGATAVAQVSGGAVISITVQNAGSGYSSSPTVIIAPPQLSFAYGTFWSNDGTSSAGSEPVAIVPVVVQQGLFTVFLGDTNLPNMMSIPASTFLNPDVHVRIWFNDGIRGFSQLSPDQRVSAVGYAMIAAQFPGPVADNQLSANVARLDGTQQIFSGPVNFSNESSAFAGRFTGNGASLSNLNPSALNFAGPIVVNSDSFHLFSVGVGSRPRSVTTLDVNRDNRIDLINVNVGADSVSVSTNNGRGGFALATTLPVGDNPVWITSADVNGDGHADFITANEFSFTLSVLTNNGSGGFALSSSPSVSTYPRAVAAADLNGDGHTDLVSAHNTPNVLTVLTNNGKGAFTLSSLPATGSSPICVAAADFDGDGDIDLASANYNDNTLSILTNNGRAEFALASSPGVGTNPNTVVAADVNGDGRSDLISANQAVDSLSVLTNNGSGAFVLSSSHSVGSQPHGLTAADINGDGRADLISANFFADTLSLMTNNGSGLFLTAATLSVGTHPHGVVAADVGGDGHLDLISADLDSNTLTVLVLSPYRFSGNFDGRFTGDGSGLSLNAANLTSGIVADARLSGNIARRAGGNAFVGNQTVTGGSVGIGTATPVGVLDVNSGGGTMSVRNESGLTSMVLTGGTVPGVLRFRNALEVWPNTGGTTAGRVDVRNLTGVATINLNGANGQITAVSLTQTSDRNAKESFCAIDPRKILDHVTALPISRWKFKADPSSEHIGPMAQDFYSAFNVGSDDRHINTVDADGVALAAIQGLNQKLEEQLRKKDAELAQMNKRLSALEKIARAQP